MQEKNKVYCCNNNCPFKDCDKHLNNVRNLAKQTVISVANLDGVCKRYISHLVDIVLKG